MLLGSSHQELYLIRKYGRSLNADRLQRNRGLLANLFYSGARLIGIAPVHDADRRIVKVLPVPMSFRLLSVSSPAMALWSDWSNPGSESVVWEVGLRALLRRDLTAHLDIQQQRQARSEQITVADAYLMPVEAGDERAVLVILSACYPNAAANDGNATVKAQLWMHTLELKIHGATAATASSEEAEDGESSAAAVIHRMLVSEGIDFRPDYERNGGAAEDRGYVAPKLSGLLPSWRVYACWAATPAAAAAAEDAPNANAGSTLHCMQCDVLNQPLVGGGRGGGAGVSGAGGGEQCQHEVDSGILCSAVVSASAVRGVDGICVIQRGRYSQV